MYPLYSEAFFSSPAASFMIYCTIHAGFIMIRYRRKGAMYMMNPLYFIAGVLVLAIIFSVISYLMKSSAYKKGIYGKKVVNKALKKFASIREMTVLSDVAVKNADRTILFDHVLVGYFGVLFVQTIQGKGSFYGDSKEPVWTFTDEKQKVTFKNPLTEMEEKVEQFREVLAKNKIYNVSIESAVTVVSLGEEPKMYLSNIPDSANILLEKELMPLLRKERFEKDNQIDPKAILALFEKQ